MRVRSYAIQPPVEVQRILHDERFQMESHPAGRAADVAVLHKRSTEASALGKATMVDKEVHVVEEIGITEQAADRVKTIRDIGSRTRAEVEDDTSGTVPAPITASAGVDAGTLAGSTTSEAGALDTIMNPNVGGTNSNADALDGTRGNPPGTMAGS